MKKISLVVHQHDVICILVKKKKNIASYTEAYMKIKVKIMKKMKIRDILNICPYSHFSSYLALLQTYANCINIIGK